VKLITHFAIKRLGYFVFSGDEIKDVNGEWRKQNLSFFLSFAPQPSLGPWPPPQNPAEFLGGFSTIFFFTG
jgi:hypothetical protein